MSDHKPDRSKLPKALQGCEWKELDPTKLPDAWENGDFLLAAVAVRNSRDDSRKGWRYELSVVRIDCDAEYFRLECEGEAWGWELEDIDFYLEL